MNCALLFHRECYRKIRIQRAAPTRIYFVYMKMDDMDEDQRRVETYLIRLSQLLNDPFCVSSFMVES